MNRTTAALTLLTLTACGSGPVVDAPSRNHNSRVNYLVIHFTTENFADSLALLTEPSDNPVSSHYLIPEPNDSTYPERSLRVYRLVDESRRAWHAGQSYWNGEESLNDRSIGIELVNRSYCIDDAEDASAPASTDASADIPEDADHDSATDIYCFYPDFADAQIELLIELARDILERYPEIDPVDVVGHADIAPDRKVDPGPRFPWQYLYRAGIGAWYDDDTVLAYWRRFREEPPSLVVVQRALRAYGYRIEPTGVADAQSRDVVRAFQMHFRPSSVTGDVDAGTAAVLFALLEKYRGDTLDELSDVEPDAAGDVPVPGGGSDEAPDREPVGRETGNQ